MISQFLDHDFQLISNNSQFFNNNSQLLSNNSQLNKQLVDGTLRIIVEKLSIID